MAGSSRMEMGRASLAPISGKPFELENKPSRAKIADILTTVWRNSTIKTIARLTAAGESTVKAWLAAKSGMNVDHLYGLLDTPQGFEVLNAVMGDCKQRWWIVICLAQQTDQQKRDIKRAERQLEQLRDMRAQLEMDM